MRQHKMISVEKKPAAVYVQGAFVVVALDGEVFAREGGADDVRKMNDCTKKELVAAGFKRF